MANQVLTTNIKELVGALVAQGVHEFVVSPGSRTTPIALLLAEMAHLRDDVRVTVDVDERSAGFFALGMAKTMHQPVALLATSGTATANYLPAIVEAQISHVPLIALTTDRPQELQGVGAPQTITQTNMYGAYVKEAMAIALQDAHPDVTAFINYRTQQLVATALQAPAGPVQVNLPLRKPLMPDLGEPWSPVQQRTIVNGVRLAQLDDVATLLSQSKTMILAGPDETGVPADLINAVGERFAAPILADVLSNVRGTGAVVNGIDSLLEAGAVSASLTPTTVLRLGGTPVSARVLTWLREKEVQLIQVGTNFVGHDHSRQTTMTIDADEKSVLAGLLRYPGKADDGFRATWLDVAEQLNTLTNAETLTEVSLPQALRALPAESQVFIANSMPIRDMDNYYVPDFPMMIAANRGANGIDGTVSTALGMAMSGRPTTLVTGDLTLFHDMNGLMMIKQAQLSLTVVVVNNNGGGIFSFLPQTAAKDYFEPMFGTPLNLDMKKVAALYDATYDRPTSMTALAELLHTPATGLRLIEVTSDRLANVEQHQALITKIKEKFHG